MGDIKTFGLVKYTLNANVLLMDMWHMGKCPKWQPKHLMYEIIGQLINI